MLDSISWNLNASAPSGASITSTFDQEVESTIMIGSNTA